MIQSYFLGGASGIGKGYALELAKEGFSIFFIDKDEPYSIATKKELDKLGVRCEYLIYDFGHLGSSDEAKNFVSTLDSAMKGKDVGKLIFKSVNHWKIIVFSFSYSYLDQQCGRVPTRRVCQSIYGYYFQS